MPSENSNHVRAAALSALAAWFVALAAAPSAHADVGDYEFRLVDKEVKKGEAIVSVRLARKPVGEAVPDAVIFATRLDMAPEGMETMETMVEPAPSLEPGVYKFKVDLTMEGKWRLSLAAKVQGETGTLASRLILKALP